MKRRLACAALLALSLPLFAQDRPVRQNPRPGRHLTARDEAKRLAAGLSAEAALVARRLAACGAAKTAAELEAARARAGADSAAGRPEAANTALAAALASAKKALAAKAPAAPAAKRSAAEFAARAAAPAVRAGVPAELAAARSLLDTLEAGCTARAGGAPGACAELLARARAGFEHARELLAAKDPGGARLARETTRELAAAVAQYAKAAAEDAEEPDSARM